MTDIKIIPYCEIDGIRTFSDTEIYNLYEKMLLESKNIFIDGSVKSPDDFLTLFKYGGHNLYVINYKDDTAAFAFLNHFDNKTAQIHFCIFKKYWGTIGTSLGRELLKNVLTIKDRDDKTYLDVLIGIVPLENKHANRYAIRVGGKRVGYIPNLIWNEEHQQSEGATLFYFLREFIT